MNKKKLLAAYLIYRAGQKSAEKESPETIPFKDSIGDMPKGCALACFITGAVIGILYYIIRYT